MMLKLVSASELPHKLISYVTFFFCFGSGELKEVNAQAKIQSLKQPSLDSSLCWHAIASMSSAREPGSTLAASEFK